MLVPCQNLPVASHCIQDFQALRDEIITSPAIVLSFSSCLFPLASAEPELKWSQCRTLHFLCLLLGTLLNVHLCMPAPSFPSTQKSPPQSSPSLISLPKLFSFPSSLSPLTTLIFLQSIHLHLKFYTSMCIFACLLVYCSEPSLQ